MNIFLRILALTPAIIIVLWIIGWMSLTISGRDTEDFTFIEKIGGGFVTLCKVLTILMFVFIVIALARWGLGI